MDTLIKPRASKPRVHQRPILVWQKYWSKGHQEELADRVYLPRYVCYDDNVRAVGKTIEGAYKNWVSLCEEHLNVLSSDRDYK